MKFEFLLSLRLLECEIKELTNYSRVYCDGYEILKIKLDELCELMVREETIRQWIAWGRDEDVQRQAKRLREAAIEALCNVEKHQSKCISRNEMNVNKYLTTIIQSVKDDLISFGIDYHSKVLFIGSGAFPVSALTIAKEFGAKVMGVDIDPEAVFLASHVAKAFDIETMVSFSGEELITLTFLKETTHIIIASLVENKIEVLDQLKELIKNDVKIMLRYGNGVKSLFNYPFDCDLSGDWHQRKLIVWNPIYDIIILEKSTSQKEKKTITHY
ncbi:nicotianamine synthase family protein [Paenibacillus sp. yr247]|uniref:nicotianamine synthase family protein n=1 Tax=Paenibacillus sp. yr247 TaxID=1761880 RepID=UPI001587B6A4|nr:nicotianamine synthase family protein [Paenibacillus sp. yr247]